MYTTKKIDSTVQFVFHSLPDGLDAETGFCFNQTNQEEKVLDVFGPPVDPDLEYNPLEGVFRGKNKVTNYL